MSERVDLGEEVGDKESGRPVVFDSLSLYDHLQRSVAALRMTRDMVRREADSSSLPSSE